MIEEAVDGGLDKESEAKVPKSSPDGIMLQNDQDNEQKEKKGNEEKQKLNGTDRAQIPQSEFEREK